MPITIQPALTIKILSGETQVIDDILNNHNHLAEGVLACLLDDSAVFANDLLRGAEMIVLVPVIFSYGEHAKPGEAKRPL